MTENTTENTYERFVPRETRAFVDVCIAKARTMLQEDGFLEPVAIIGVYDGGIQATILSGLGRHPKDVSAQRIRETATKLDADFVLHVDEVWSAPIRGATLADYNRLLEQYGEIRNMPERIDAVMFSLHTHVGHFVGVAERVTLDEAAQRYTFGEVDMGGLEESRGQFANLLPPRGRAQ